jgi:signal transduction histidine kinase
LRSGIDQPFLPLVRELDGHVPMPVLCVDPTGTICEAAMPATVACSGADLIGRSLEQMVGGEPMSFVRELVALQESGHARVALELPVDEALDRVEAYVALVERSSDGADAAPRCELLPGIVDAAPLSLLGLSAEKTIAVSNAACRELLGDGVRDLIGAPLSTLFEDPAEARRFDLELCSRDPQPYCGVLRCSSGESRCLELIPRALFGGLPRAVGWVVWVRDPAASPEDGAGESPERRVRDVAHDLRSPLCAVRGFASLLERDCADGLGALGRSYLERLRAGVDRMQGLIEDLLGASSTRATLEARRWLMPGDVFQALKAELKPQLEERETRLGLPADPAPVFADPTRFYQVLLNLVTNALQHMGSVERPLIEIDVEERDDARVVVVRDNGRGIDPEHHSRIFEAFERGATGGSHRGTGLGLAIVKRAMDAHRGSIEIDSEVGRGATFRATFPNARS